MTDKFAIETFTINHALSHSRPVSRLRGGYFCIVIYGENVLLGQWDFLVKYLELLLKKKKLYCAPYCQSCIKFFQHINGLDAHRSYICILHMLEHRTKTLAAQLK